MSLHARVRARAGNLALDVEIKAAAGETVVLVGPNGAGKTTLLRALAGLLPLAGGRVTLDDEVLEDPASRRRLPPEHRSVGFVFQDYVLFPHLSVLDNVAFGLRAARGRSKDEARTQAREWLERMGLVGYAAERPRVLSGGQAQRVALARALATRPRMLLLDEPLAALDAGARAEVRRELKSSLSRFDGVRLVVTHDPVEAMALADRVVVIEGGRVVQEGTPSDLSARPRSSYIAELVGLNLWRGQGLGDRVRLDSGGEMLVSHAPEGEVYAALHPRAVALYRSRVEGSPRNVWRGRISRVESDGGRVRIRVEGSIPVVAEVTPVAVAERSLIEGEEIWVSIKATEVSVYPA
ncbi:MAG: ABC transporter ATP-binding protein [Actinomycetota bacterium]